MIKAAISFLMTCLLLTAPASAQEPPVGPPSATVKIEQLQVAFIGSGAAGGGTLKFGGRSYAHRW